MDKRGRLASRGLDGQPVKGVFFFPGERGGNAGLYTVHPLDPRDAQWNSHPETRRWVIDRMVRAHVNTIVMSYWSDMPFWSPMALDATSLSGVLDAVAGRRLTILPAIEGGHDPSHPAVPQWELGREFPRSVDGLVERIGRLVALFEGRRALWTRLYDRVGQPRYAIQLIHVCSHLPEVPSDSEFVSAFDSVSDTVYRRFGIRVGFTLDAIAGQRYSLDPRTAGSALERSAAILAIQGFASEVFSGRVRTGPPGHPRDNNGDNLDRLLDWRRDTLRAWVRTGVPVILDVSSGFDGRIVWGSLGTGFWGDNADYTDDRWRNGLSQLKGEGLSGIVVNTWNGYTEGFAATPTVEHGTTIYDWMTDLLTPSPTAFHHVHYVDGRAAFTVSGAICEKWQDLGGERGFGPPTGPERPARRGRVQSFGAERSIFWSTRTGARAVRGPEPA